VHRRVLDLRRGILHGHGVFENGRRPPDGRAQPALRLARRPAPAAAGGHGLPGEPLGRRRARRVAGRPGPGGQPPPPGRCRPAKSIPDLDVQRFTTQASAIEICLAARTTLAGSGKDAVSLAGAGTIGETLTFRRYVVVYTSRDSPTRARGRSSTCGRSAGRTSTTALEAHAARWEEVWERADVRIDGSPATEQALRFNAYHLSAPPTAIRGCRWARAR
jgi:hypothetical protein